MGYIQVQGVTKKRSSRATYNMLFSEREGFSDKPILLRDSISAGLRVRLWNIIEPKLAGARDLIDGLYLNSYAYILWDRIYKQPNSNLADTYTDGGGQIKQKFFASVWFKVYDAFELLFEWKKEIGDPWGELVEQCNQVLEEEGAAWRFRKDGTLIGITSQVEIDEYEAAITAATPYIGVKTHLTAAGSLMSKREAPQYAGSMHESISAVEAIVKLITGENKFRNGLKKLKELLGISGKLTAGYKEIYDYTSSEEGIRHGTEKESRVSSADARLMLITCSAFVNYLIAKCTEMHVEISGSDNGEQSGG